MKRKTTKTTKTIAKPEVKRRVMIRELTTAVLASVAGGGGKVKSGPCGCH